MTPAGCATLVAEPVPDAVGFRRLDCATGTGSFVSTVGSIRARHWLAGAVGRASVGETITCFTLVGSERVVVPVTALTGISGIYEFAIISDHHIDPVDSAVPSTDPQTGTGATTLPVPVLITTTAPLSLADAAILALGEQIDEDSDDLVQTLMASDAGFIQQAGYGPLGSAEPTPRRRSDDQAGSGDHDRRLKPSAGPTRSDQSRHRLVERRQHGATATHLDTADRRRRQMRPPRDLDRRARGPTPPPT